MNLRRLLTERTTFGAWLSIGHTMMAEIMGSAGYDWVIVDLQHGAVSEAELLPLLQVLDASGTPVLVRVRWPDPAQIMRVLDLGAAGVIVPMVSTADDARLVAEAMRYPPHGNRSFGPVRKYYMGSEAVSEPLCLVMIETAEALQSLDAIAATEGVDGMFVGTVDLGLSLGQGIRFEMTPPVLEAIDRVIETCGRHGKIAGSVAFGLPGAKDLMARGAKFVAIGIDSLFVRRGAAADLQEIRSWQGET